MASASALPAWLKPQLTKLVDASPDASEWLHEIKLDGYRMHARLDRGAVRLLTRTGLEMRPRKVGLLEMCTGEVSSTAPTFPVRILKVSGCWMRILKEPT
jgi:hypothetical protein